MNKFYVLLVVMLCSVSVYGQQEFLRDKGGLTVEHGWASYSEGGNVNAWAMAFSFKKGFTIGVAGADVGGQVEPLFSVGLISKPKIDKSTYSRGYIMAGYLKTGKVRIMSLNAGISHLFNAQKIYRRLFQVICYSIILLYMGIHSWYL